MSFFDELKRRNVFRVGIAYTVATWLLIQVTDTVFPRIGLPDSAVTLVIALLLIGFIPALIIAWAFEMTPEGIKREKDVDRTQSVALQTGKKLDRIIIAGLVLIILGMAIERAWFAGQNEPANTPLAAESQSAQTGNSPAAIAGERPDHRESVAVLPFTAMSSGEDDGYFADGLTEEILNSLARLPELLVTARTSSFHFKDKDLPIPEIAATLGVEHVVEGSVRRSGERVRMTTALYLRTDLFGHIIYDHASNLKPASQAELEQACKEIKTGLTRAMQTADNDAQRAILDAERTLLSNHWTGLADKLDQAFVPGDCTPVNAVGEAATLFGWAEALVEHTRELALCDPMSATPAYQLPVLEVASGNAQAGVEAAEKFLKKFGFHPWIDDGRFTALLATGHYHEDPNIADEANEVASRVDARFGGPVLLQWAVSGCMCGAPFDLDVTPNYRRRIEESGFQWPPITPIAGQGLVMSLFGTPPAGWTCMSTVTRSYRRSVDMHVHPAGVV